MHHHLRSRTTIASNLVAIAQVTVLFNEIHRATGGTTSIERHVAMKGVAVSGGSRAMRHAVVWGPIVTIAVRVAIVSVATVCQVGINPRFRIRKVGC